MPAELDAATATIEASCRDWMETCGSIRGRDGTMIRDIRLNELQFAIDDAVEWCEVNRQPCRIIVLKPRKEGSTTALVGKSYHLLRSREAHLVQVGDQYSTSQTMWAMLKTYNDTDRHRWTNKVKRFTGDAKSGQAEWTHGATAWTDTAGDSRAGQSKTPTIIHTEEVAHWGADGKVGSAADTMLALLNSIADLPGTYVFVSSTANGVGNWYHRTFSGAVSLDERKRGIRGNGWIAVFLPWQNSLWCRQPVTDIERGVIETTLTQAETRGVALHGWTPEQIAWRRDTIATKCDGDEGKFSQEFPTDSVSCFLSSGRPRFSLEGMTRLELAASLDKAERVGRLDEIGNAKALVFSHDSTPEGWLWLREKPVPGGRYVAALDPMTGEQAGGKDPDCHAFGVLRLGYTDGRAVYPDELVAAIHVEGGCRWDADQIASKAARVCAWYGDCMIIPEVNVALDVLDKLRDAGCDIYRREEPADHINPGTRQKIIGWKTTAVTRPLIISAVAEAVRDGTLACLYRPVIEQMRTFVVNDRGRAEAMSGKHDDHVLMLGIALHNRECATTHLNRIQPSGHTFLAPNEGALS